MNQARRIEILEELVSNVDGFSFADFQMDLDAQTGDWTASEFVNGDDIAVNPDPVECYDWAVKYIERRNAPKTYSKELERLVTKMADRKTIYTKEDFRTFRAEARRILKLKELGS